MLASLRLRCWAACAGASGRLSRPRGYDPHVLFMAYHATFAIGTAALVWARCGRMRFPVPGLHHGWSWSSTARGALVWGAAARDMGAGFAGARSSTSTPRRAFVRRWCSARARDYSRQALLPTTSVHAARRRPAWFVVGSTAAAPTRQRPRRRPSATPPGGHRHAARLTLPTVSRRQVHRGGRSTAMVVGWWLKPRAAW